MCGLVSLCRICQPLKRAFALWLLALILPVASVHADEAEMQRIVKAHKKWMASVVSLHLTCEIKYDPFSEANRQAGTTGQQVTQTLEWAWTDRGHYRNQYTFTRNGMLESRYMFLDDTERSFRVTYASGPSKEVDPAKVEIGPSRGGSELIVTPLYGLWFPRNNGWLGSLLAAGKGTFDGYETMNGIDCPKVSVERAPGVFVTVILDPEHGYLPVVAEDGKQTFYLHVRTFREFHPSVWIPDLGESHTYDQGKVYDTKEWRIVEVALNRDLPTSLFRPNIPKGTLVVDSLRGDYYRQGMPRRSPNRQQMAREARENLDNLPEPGSDLSAVPQPFFWRRWGANVLILISVVLVSTALWLWWRRTNSHPDMET